MSRVVPTQTLERQRLASDPGRSVWVSANAGSGKTHVLSQRVVRLMLDGVNPARILCLTFTKAAAANMSERVFAILARWTQLDDDALRAAIRATGARAPSAATLIAARRLFARAVETPGGLKIQTIHAFCERLLHLFPFEANVSAGFTVAEDSEQAEWLDEARRSALAEAAGDEGALGAALRRVADETSQSDFDALIRAAMKARETLPIGASGEARLRKALGLARGETTAAVERAMLEDGLLASGWKSVGDALAQGKPTDIKRADQIFAVREAWAARGANDAAPVGASLIDAYLRIFFNSDNTPAKALATKDIPQAVKDALVDEQRRLAALRETRASVGAYERSVALARLVGQIFSRYEATKRRRGALDFDDLITRTLTLLERSDASWVLYKLDRGIDHILVDEAQDTSAAQWRILDILASEFTAGEGQRKGRRSFFAVGDDKQSIFSFQGAEPRLFHEMSRRFAQRAAQAGQDFSAVRLNLSFRSTRTILDAVDKVFAPVERHRGLSSGVDPQPPVHESWKSDLPGLVEIWPPLAAPERDDPTEWRLPVDAPRADDPAVKLAERVAAKIAALTSSPEARVSDGESGLMRRVRPGDVMILVRKRGAFFEAMIRALKERGVAVAGADRLNVTQHIAVMDLIAAGRVALLPQDDLTLACVLKSPLIGLDDDDLIALAPGRAGSLFAALESSPVARHRAALARIEMWRAHARTRTPFEFYMRLVEADGGRRALVSRLGPEAADAIDEFVALALDHETHDAPSLTLFLQTLGDADIEIKRDMEAAGDAVRVMTVHAAKGLEAKIVFLPDTCSGPSAQHAPKLHRLDEEATAWSSRKGDDSAAISTARAAAEAAAQDEYHRLLYVAMTRAEERLYIAGHYGRRRPTFDWHRAMFDALSPDMEEIPAPWDAAEIIWRRVEVGAAQDDAPAEPPDAAREKTTPAWLNRPARPEIVATPPLRPSNALDAADALPREGATENIPARRAARGKLLHALLQHLPAVAPARRAEAAHKFLGARGAGFTSDETAAMAREALGVLNDARLAALFGAGSRAEAAIAGRVRLADGREVEISGQIDRLAETAEEILLADFKSGAPRAAAETPERILTQFALYRAALQPLWPEKPIRTMLIWTAGPALVELNGDLLDRALARLAAP